MLLKTFSTTNAALDIIYTINNVSNANDSVYIYGVSYGTYIGQRILLLETLIQFPLKAVILDSVCAYSKCDLLTYNYHFDQTVKDFLSQCEQDSSCSQNLANVTLKTTTLYSYLNGSSQNYVCSSLLTNYGITSVNYRLFQSIFGYLVSSGDPRRQLIVPILKRLDRCSQNDITDLKNLFSFFNIMPLSEVEVGDSPSKQYTYGNMLFINIAISELFATSSLVFSGIPTVQQYLDTEKKFEFISSPGTEDIITDSYVWPNYTNLDGNITLLNNNTNTTILLLNGNLDPQTPLDFAEYAFSFYKNNNTKRLIEFNGCKHGILTYPCGVNVIIDFLLKAGNLSNINTDCVQNLTVDFSASSDSVKNASILILGTNDVWGNRSQPQNPNVFPWTTVYIVVGVVGGLIIVAILFYIAKRARADPTEKKRLLESK